MELEGYGKMGDSLLMLCKVFENEVERG